MLVIIHCTVGCTADAENILSAENPELSKVFSGFMQNKQNYIKTDSNLREELFTSLGFSAVMTLLSTPLQATAISFISLSKVKWGN